MSVDPAPAAPVPLSARRARRPVQIGGFLRKETASVIRRSRLLLVLVAGPFLILLLFAVGYDEQQSVLRTAFVGPEGSVHEVSIDQFTDELKRYVESAGYSDDLVAAEQQLQDGDIDAIVVFPADPLERVLRGEQAEITVLHDTIDPIQQVAVEVSAQVAVMELNARVLEEIVSRAQDTLVDTLGSASSELAECSTPTTPRWLPLPSSDSRSSSSAPLSTPIRASRHRRSRSRTPCANDSTR